MITDNNINLSKLVVINDDGTQSEIGCGVLDLGFECDHHIEESFSIYNNLDNEVSIPIKCVMIKKWHRKKKGKKYWPYYEYVIPKKLDIIKLLKLEDDDKKRDKNRLKNHQKYPK